MVLPLLVGASVLHGAAASMNLSGYVCPTCASTPDPNSIVANMPAVYNIVNFAFVGWDATNGSLINQFDDASKGFRLTAQQVATLRSQGRTVMISIGGGAGGIITGTESAAFRQNLAAGLLDICSTYGFDGVDFDIEHRSGDLKACASVINDVLKILKQKNPAIKISFAPQMVNLDPAVSVLSAGFNELAPVIGPSLSLIDWIQPQMYNSWAGVETLAYAQQYLSALQKGYTVAGVVVPPIPASKILLGYPATPSGASSGFIEPCDIVAAFRDVHPPIMGLMTWDIGWDQQGGYHFSTCVRQG
eukprot:TRINITY_DN6020_c0_g1_i1.p3 TRINITY_DN6020_c0_g1~~TRINITY_DN6020_c0_g1_i1.p3  ORF type:complete len:322 (+),score=107.43 TRINITY_DN6020_c0_g1_i1:58-966(+)